MGTDSEESYEFWTDGPRVIVAGVDGSTTSMRAGSYAAGLARRQNARLVIVYVAGRSSLADMAPGGALVTEQTMDEIADDLRREITDGAARLGVRAEFIVTHGDPLSELARIADEVHADGVVVGVSEKIGHRLVGSLAVRLVRIGHWPVTVVP
ncbi:universal stress protein [Actinomadura sp. HBU206391]|uniref:universal stress protein n=1 Tax=Actinomadura sp. HBU206391 TaxID=2731692 RepID=UPI002905C31B|nr:universal stress protein [Actinomadura sp. HBU206391]